MLCKKKKKKLILFFEKKTASQRAGKELASLISLRPKGSPFLALVPLALAFFFHLGAPVKGPERLAVSRLAMSGGRGRAGGGGGNASSTSRATSRPAAKRQPSPSPSRWPAATAGVVSTSSFGELWGAITAVAAAPGIKKQARQVEREGREAMLTSASMLEQLKPATRTAKQQPQPLQPRPRPSPSPLLLPRGAARGTIRAHVPSRRPVSARAAASSEAAAGVRASAAAAGGGAAAAAASPSLSASPPPLLPEEIAARLDSAPALSALDLAVALLASALAFSLTSALTHLRREGASRAAAAAAAAAPAAALPSSLTPLPLLAALTALALALSAARERAFASRAFSARELADQDSRFAELLGVEVHYKVAKPVAAAAATGGSAAGGGGGERGSAGPIRFSIAAMHGA